MRKLALVSILFVVMVTGAFSSAGAQAADNIFIPGSAWLVGPSSLTPASGEATRGLPCIMMNQYNNGFIVRISGGGGKIMAMAVDFRQDVFKANKDYNINIRIPETSFDANIPARAYNRQSLLFGTHETIGLYDALKKARTLEVTIGKKTLEFAMIGARDGIDRMEACYSGTNVYKQEPKAEHSKASPAGFGRNDKAMAASVSPMGTASISASVPTGEAAEDEELVLTPLPTEGDETGTSSLNIEDTLKQATDSLYTMEPAAGVPRAPKESAVPEAQPQTVSQEQNTAKNWQSPLAPEKNKNSASGQRKILVPPTDGRQSYQPIEAEEEMASQSNSPVRRWRAIRGSNLREVLDNWSQGADVRLLWLSDRDFPVKESMILQGSFEEAVLALLEQYEGRNVPTGRMYNDPAAAGQRVLLIERH